MNTLIDKISSHSKKLDVYVGEKLAGHISRVLSEDGGTIIYRFTYSKQAKAADFVSLTMPVRDKPWDYPGRLHPVFQQNLPEGAQLSMMLQRFGKVVMDEDMVLLGMTGAQSIGRVKVVPNGFDLNWNNLPSVDMDALKVMPNTKKYLYELMESCVHTQGVSGQMPKALVDSSTKATLKTSRHIIKTETDEFTGAILSEALCLQAALDSGLSVASGMMSEDGLTLASERFDVDGFEDMCSILGMDCHRKARGDIDKVARAIAAISTQAKEDLRTLFKWHIFNMVVGNSESHLKNLGFVYTKGEVKLAPIYDVLCTRAFDHLKNDLPSMMVGKNRSWEIDHAFYESARMFGVTSVEIDKMKADVHAAVKDLVNSLPDMIDAYPHFAAVGKNMIDILNSGCDMLTSKSQTSQFEDAGDATSIAPSY